MPSIFGMRFQWPVRRDRSDDFGSFLQALDDIAPTREVSRSDMARDFRRTFLTDQPGRRVLRQILAQCGVYGVRDARGALVRMEDMSEAERAAWMARRDVGLAIAETVFSETLMNALIEETRKTKGVSNGR